jgi:uncharacterized protein (DUF924 family)
MIVKELDEFSSANKFTKAGRAAEEQIAYYLLLLQMPRMQR